MCTYIKAHMHGKQAEVTTLNKRISSLQNVKEAVAQRMSIRFVVSVPLARSTCMSRTVCLTGILQTSKQPGLLLHRSETWLDPNNLTPSGQLTVGYTQAKLFLCSPGIALEKYMFLSLCFFPRLRQTPGRPFFMILLLAEEIQENPRSRMMKRERERERKRKTGVVPKYNVLPLECSIRVLSSATSPPTAPSTLNSTKTSFLFSGPRRRPHFVVQTSAKCQECYLIRKAV